MATKGLDGFIFKEIFMNYCGAGRGSPLLSSPLITAEGEKRVLKKTAERLRTTYDLFIKSQCESEHKFLLKSLFEFSPSRNSFQEVSQMDLV